jgi:hypothetical protein
LRIYRLEISVYIFKINRLEIGCFGEFGGFYWTFFTFARQQYSMNDWMFLQVENIHLGPQMVSGFCNINNKPGGGQEVRISMVLIITSRM